MNWTDFLFGAVAGVSLALTVAAFFLYRVMRPYIQAASVAAKAQAEGRAKRARSGGGPGSVVWPSFGTSNRPEGDTADGNS